MYVHISESTPMVKAERIAISPQSFLVSLLISPPTIPK